MNDYYVGKRIRFRACGRAKGVGVGPGGWKWYEDEGTIFSVAAKTVEVSVARNVSIHSIMYKIIHIRIRKDRIVE